MEQMLKCYKGIKGVVDTSTGIVTHLSQANQIKSLGVYLLSSKFKNVNDVFHSSWTFQAFIGFMKSVLWKVRSQIQGNFSSISSIPRFPKDECFSRVSHFRPFILEIRTICGWGWVLTYCNETKNAHRCIKISYIINTVTYLLIPRSRPLLEKVTGSQLVKKFVTFYGTRRFIIAITSALQLSLPWANILCILCLNYKILLHIYVHSLVSLPYWLSQFTVMKYSKLIYAICVKRWHGRTVGVWGFQPPPPPKFRSWAIFRDPWEINP
jgi:hypothetical protein